MQSVRSLSEQLRELLLGAGICARTVDEIELCVAECVNNIIEHGYRLDSRQQVRLEVDVDVDSVCLRIRDRSEPFDLSKLPPPPDLDPRQLEKLPERGMGANVIRSLMNKIAYDSTDDGNCTTLIRILKPGDRDRG